MESRGGDRVSGETVRRSVVLAGGGVVGTAWMAGLAAELRRRGIDLGAAESIVGTSAGAIIGAALVVGRDLDSFADDPRPPGYSEPPAVVKREAVGAAFAIMADRTMDPDARRRKMGRMAMAEEPAQPSDIAELEWLVDGNEWPDHRLRVVVVDAESGERLVWDNGSGVPLARAIAASRAFPGLQRPVVVEGRYYIDGGVWSATNADLAVASNILLVVEPLAFRIPPEQLQAELATTSADRVVHFHPDAATADVFTSFAANPDPLASWPHAFRGGVRQGEDLAKQLIDAGW
ncbi:patatin-like phospholipase family protein [Nocardia sp. NPDC059240]|uniref:patatin-like phospholipase family protein n=1 Tax=Nocardia sp. NPDC059240 TaxID=3346786 RepID=UPI0036A481AA